VAAKRLAASSELLILPKNLTAKMAALYEEKKKGSLLHFCSDEKSIDEVERVSKYNGYPHAGNAYYYIFSRKKTVSVV